MKPSERMAYLENARSSATLEHNYKKALREVAKVLRANSYDPDALILRGNILDLDRKFSASRQCYMKVIRRYKTNVRALIDMGDWYARREDVTKALSFYDRALGLLKKGIFYISRSEEFEEAHQSKILLLRDAGMFDEARQAIKEAKIDCPWLKPPRLRGNKKRESKGAIR